MSYTLPDLPDGARVALSKAALLEDAFPTQALLADGSAPEALDPLFDLGLLEEAGPVEACVASEGIREAALRGLSWSAKRRLCESLAEACLALGMDSGLVARLYLQAHRHGAARKGFVVAAEQACERNAHREALELMRAAFEIWPEGESPDERRRVLLEMARCARACSDHASAELALAELLETADDATEAAVRIDLQRQLAHVALANGDRTRARGLLREAAELAEASGLAAEAARLWRSLVQALGDALRLKDALAVLEKARTAAKRCQDFALLSDSLAYAAMLTAMLGRIGEANTMLEEALNLAIERDLPDQITNAYRRQANVNEYAANYQAYRDTELAALDRCRTLGEEGGAQACLSCVSYAFFRLGQFDESLAAVKEAVEERGAEGELRAIAVAVRACVHALRGTGSDILIALEEARRQIRLQGALVFEFYLLWAKGAFATLEGQDAVARASFCELIDFWRETDDRKDACPGLLCASSFFAQENDAEQLARCLDILNTIQSSSESTEPPAAFFASSGETAWLEGRSGEAIELLGEAVARYADMKLPFEEAWVLWRLGHVQSQTGKDVDAAASWKRAEAIAQKLSLRPLVRALKRERSEASAVSQTVSPLTPRQLEIVRLIAAGRTNKEAAAELKISPRTVEMHVAALLERLGCRSRAEAAKRVGEMGLLG